jgi:hypothetical protein
MMSSTKQRDHCIRSQEKHQMAFYAPRIPLTILAVLLATGAVLLGASAASAASCKPGQIQWIVKGKATCLKTNSLNETKKPGPKASDWVKAISNGKAPVKGFTSKLVLPAKLRSATPALARAASTLAVKAAAADPNSFKPKKRSRNALTAAAGPAVVGTMEIAGPTSNSGGTEITTSAQLKQFENGSVEATIILEAKAAGFSVRYTPIIDLSGSGIPEVNCPTAAGKLSISDSDTFGGTMIVLKGNRVLGARTIKASSTMRAEGQVGRDARLASVSAHVTSKFEYYERGFQMVINMDGNFSIQREGEVTPVGAPSINVKVKSAQHSAAQEDAAAKQLATESAIGDRAKSFGHPIDLARWRMMQDEYKWYQLPNYCANVSFDPESVAKVQQGQTKPVKGIVTAKGGGESAGSFAVNSVAHGSLTAVKAAVDPGSPAIFSATGGKPAADKSTVTAEVIATSRAGRSIGTWYAEGDDVKVPTSFGGYIEATTEGNGLKYHFDVFANFNLTYVNTGPNGFATAWYEFSHFSDVKESTNEIGIGCRWVAKSTNAQINSGDVELRRASSDADWTYAIHLDFSMPNETFTPTDCPPGAELPAFTGDVVNYIYTKAPDAAFRPIWSGSTESDMRLIEMTSVSDVVGAGSLPTTANWGLIGSYD